METSQNSVKEEQVKPDFDLNKLLQCQERTWQLLHQLKTKIAPGMSEADAQQIYMQLQQESGAEKYWHPPKIRFGVNTLRAFREPSEPDVRLKENDIYFLDFGPIYDGYEGDVGQTFTLGQYPVANQIIAAGEEIFKKVALKFKADHFQGIELYQYAEQLAKEAGYELVGEGAAGHRIGDFPHAAFYRGSLKGYGRSPSPNRWILEIQLRDSKNQIGAFYEDILA